MILEWIAGTGDVCDESHDTKKKKKMSENGRKSIGFWGHNVKSSCIIMIKNNFSLAHLAVS